MTVVQRRGARGALALFVLLLAGAAWWGWRVETPPEPPEAQVAEAPRPRSKPRRRAQAPPSLPSPAPTTEGAGRDSTAPEPEVFTLRCEAEASLLEALDAVIVRWQQVPFAVEGSELVLRGVPPVGEMTLFAEGAPPMKVSWMETATPGLGRCVGEPLALTPAGRVSGVIVNRGLWPQSRVIVRACGLVVRADQAGRFEVDVPVGECDVVAQRRDGLFFASSDIVTLDVGDGDDYRLELSLPEYRQGGVGMGISEHEEGVLVERVLDGGAAAEAGLQPGDVVLEVDGVPAAALTLEEFVQVTTGEAGTEVELVISRGDGSDREESIYLLDRRVME
ncbi:PDZ domain-containing protein [Myxococcota bacterium]|nr:PDZ domain-containing protein [Myxococcota bacterium]